MQKQVQVKRPGLGAVFASRMGLNREVEFVAVCAGNAGLRQNELELALPYKHAPGSKLHRFARLLKEKVEHML